MSSPPTSDSSSRHARPRPGALFYVILVAGCYVILSSIFGGWLPNAVASAISLLTFWCGRLSVRRDR